LSIGALHVRPGAFHAPEDVASAAATAKHRAKKLATGLHIEQPPAADNACANVQVA
jgi:hypothetical protein